VKSIFLGNSSQVTLKESPKPVCSGGDVLLKMHACGICRSDLENIAGHSCKPTSKIGHEVSGTIKKKIVNVKQLITHKFSLDDAQDALNFASAGKNAMRVIVVS